MAQDTSAPSFPEEEEGALFEEEEPEQELAVLHIVGSHMPAHDHSKLFRDSEYLLFHTESTSPPSPEAIAAFVKAKGYEVTKNTMVVLQAHGGREETTAQHKLALGYVAHPEDLTTEEFLHRLSQAFSPSEEDSTPLTCLLSSCDGGSANKAIRNKRLPPESLLLSLTPAKQSSTQDADTRSIDSFITAMATYHRKHGAPSPALMASTLVLFSPQDMAATFLHRGVATQETSEPLQGKLRIGKLRREKHPVTREKGESFSPEELAAQLEAILRSPEEFLKRESEKMFRTISHGSDMEDVDSSFLRSQLATVNLDLFRAQVLDGVKRRDGMDLLKRVFPDYSEEKIITLTSADTRELLSLKKDDGQPLITFDRLRQLDLATIQVLNSPYTRRVLKMKNRSGQPVVSLDDLIACDPDKILALTAPATPWLYARGLTFAQLSRMYDENKTRDPKKIPALTSSGALDFYEKGMTFAELDRRYDTNPEEMLRKISPHIISTEQFEQWLRTHVRTGTETIAETSALATPNRETLRVHEELHKLFNDPTMRPLIELAIANDTDIILYGYKTGILGSANQYLNRIILYSEKRDINHTLVHELGHLAASSYYLNEYRPSPTVKQHFNKYFTNYSGVLDPEQVNAQIAANGLNPSNLIGKTLYNLMNTERVWENARLAVSERIAELGTLYYYVQQIQEPSEKRRTIEAINRLFPSQNGVSILDFYKNDILKFYERANKIAAERDAEVKNFTISVSWPGSSETWKKAQYDQLLTTCLYNMAYPEAFSLSEREKGLFLKAIFTGITSEPQYKRGKNVVISKSGRSHFSAEYKQRIQGLIQQKVNNLQFRYLCNKHGISGVHEINEKLRTFRPEKIAALVSDDVRILLELKDPNERPVAIFDQLIKYDAKKIMALCNASFLLTDGTVPLEQLARYDATIIEALYDAAPLLSDGTVTFDTLAKWPIDKIKTLTSPGAQSVYNTGITFSDLERIYNAASRDRPLMHKLKALTSPEAQTMYELKNTEGQPLATFEQLERMYTVAADNKAFIKKLQALASSVTQIAYKMKASFDKLETLYNDAPDKFMEKITALTSWGAEKTYELRNPHNRSIVTFDQLATCNVDKIKTLISFEARYYAYEEGIPFKEVERVYDNSPNTEAFTERLKALGSEQAQETYKLRNQDREPIVTLDQLATYNTEKIEALTSGATQITYRRDIPFKEVERVYDNSPNTEAFTERLKALGSEQAQETYKLRNQAREPIVSFHQLTTSNTHKIIALTSPEARIAYQNGVSFAELSNMYTSISKHDPTGIEGMFMDKLQSLTSENALKTYALRELDGDPIITFKKLADYHTDIIYALTSPAAQLAHNKGATFGDLERIYREDMEHDTHIFNTLTSPAAQWTYNAHASFNDLERIYREDMKNGTHIFDDLTSPDAKRGSYIEAKFNELEETYRENSEMFHALTSTSAVKAALAGSNFQDLKKIYKKDVKNGTHIFDDLTSPAAQQTYEFGKAWFNVLNQISEDDIKNGTHVFRDLTSPAALEIYKLEAQRQATQSLLAPPVGGVAPPFAGFGFQEEKSTFNKLYDLYKGDRENFNLLTSPDGLEAYSKGGISLKSTLAQVKQKLGIPIVMRTGRVAPRIIQSERIRRESREPTSRKFPPSSSGHGI